MKGVRGIGLLLGCLLMLAGTAVRAAEEAPLSAGQTIYVPVYSHIFYGDKRRGAIDEEALRKMYLSATVIIHNIDPQRPIRLTSAAYYDTHGKLVRRYLDRPVHLQALETRNFFVERNDKAGGVGANFIITWDAPEPVNTPLVESVIVHSSGTTAFAVTSRGKVIHPHHGNSATPPPQ